MMSSHGLRVGLILPVFEGDMDGRNARWSDLLAMAQRAEAVGFDSLWVVDHLLSVRAEKEGNVRQGPWECWSILSAVAAVTNRVEIGPLVTCAGFRNPALLAKMADTVDEISNGRLILGLGAGWHEPEYQAFGFPFDHRIGRFEESLMIIHGLLKTGHVDFDGTYYKVRDCELRPRGPRAGGPPIMIGTNVVGKRMLKLAARYADVWNAWTVWLQNRPSEISELHERVDAACRKENRGPTTLGRSVAIRIDLPGRKSREGETISPITGSTVEIAATLCAYANAGIGHVQIWLEPNSLAGIESFALVLEELRQTSL
jgi:alkanesulfonate monooxygenase SsuD/methylene tetrahydromethanopterin reductase-like flavin-dependent oxidoreductase (luciferase family)